MLKGLAKIKALKELKELRQNKASLKGLALIKATKCQKEIRRDLGMRTPSNTPADANHTNETTTVDKQEYADTLLFNKSAQILLAKRSAKEDVEPNKWWIIGGKIEQGETPKQGAMRELAEETGVKLSDVKFVEQTDLPTGGISHRFVGVVKDDTPIHFQKDELQAYAWVDGDKLGKYDLLGSLADLQKLVNKAGQEVGIIPLDDEYIERLSQASIDDTQDMGQGQRKGVAKNWIKENLLGKSVRTVDGKMVHFNSEDTINHIPFNVRRNALLAQCVPFIPAVFAKGEFVGREVSDPEHQAQRTDQSIKAFHLYRKWIELKNGYKVNAEVQACERENEKGLFYAGYNLKSLDKMKAVSPSHHNDNSVSTKLTNAQATTALNTTFDSLPYQGLHLADAISADTTLLSKETSNPSKMAYDHHNAMFDKLQEDMPTNVQILPLRILQVLDEHGVDIADEVLDDDGWGSNDKTEPSPNNTPSPNNEKPFDRSNIKIPKSIKARQNANNQAIAILDKLDSGKLFVGDLTDDDKTALAKYSGNGGGLVNKKGEKGSDYEYYTPHELAGGMWDLARQLGFNGGRVLDPCAGTGIFSATSPDNVLMDNIELDETSGRINQILNDGVRANTTISPFEKVVNGYDDGDDEMGFDLVMSNVPFGNNASRGANKMFDKAYQDASLDY